MREYSKIEVCCNFINDLEEYQKKKLKESKIEINYKKDIGVQYFNAVSKTIPIRKYQIFFSKQMKIPFQYKKIISEIKKKMENGENINNFLSKKIREADYNDNLLNFYGVYHLHLGEKIEKGFRKRTGELLFIYVKDNKAYFLKIGEHKNWLSKENIKIVCNEWPELLKEFEFPNLLLEDSENKVVQKKINLISLNGKAYIPQMGVASSRDNNLVVRRALSLRNSINELEIVTKNNIFNYIPKEILEYLLDNNKTLNLKLDFILEENLIVIKDSERLIKKIQISLT